MANTKCTFKVLGQTIQLDGASFGRAREIYGRKVYFAIPSFFLKPTDVVVDLGANAGVFTILAARIGRQVVAVEAQSGFIPEIISNATINNCFDKVFTECVLVGPSSGLFSDTRNREVASHFVEGPTVISMSELIARHSLEIVNFLKIDIEGSEFDLFNGEISWLSRIEKIALEVHLEFGDVNEIVSVLKNSGFDLWLPDNNQRIVDRIDGTSGYLFAKHKSPVSTALSRT